MRGSTEKAVTKTVRLEPETVKQMLSLFRAVQTAKTSYTVPFQQMELVKATADAKNVKTAFQKAAEAIGAEV